MSTFILILLLGALQGIVLAVLLFMDRKSSSRILGAILLFFAYRLTAEAALELYGWGGVQHWAYQILFEYNWVYGTLIFLYIRSLLSPNLQWQRADWIHFLPVGLEVLFSCWVKIQNLYWDGSVESLPFGGSASYQLWEHTPFQYVVAASLMLFYTRKSKVLLVQKQSDDTIVLNPKTVQWIQQILWAYTIFAVLVLLLVGIDFLFLNYAFQPSYAYWLYGLMAIITYGMGLQGYFRKEDIPVKKNTNTNLTTLQPIAEQLLTHMQQEKPYLNADLKLVGLAEQLKIKPYLLTQVLNQVLQKKFNDFINEYRVEEVKRMLQAEQFEHWTLLAIATEAGFNSKASFNRVVKKLTGQSPSQLKKGLN